MRILAILFSVLTLSLSVLAVEGPATFASLPWGATRADAKSMLSAIPGVTVADAATPKASETPKQTAMRLEAFGGTFANKPVTKWNLTFSGTKLIRGTVVFSPKGSVSGLNNELRQTLTAKYGVPTRTKKNIAEWTFSPTLSQKHTLGIELSIVEPRDLIGESYVRLSYFDETLRIEGEKNPSVEKPKTPPATPPQKLDSKSL